MSHNKFYIEEKEIARRIGCTRGSFPQYCELLQKQNIKLETHVMFLNNLVISRLSYEYHAYFKTYSERSKFSVVYSILKYYRYLLFIYNNFFNKNA